MKLESHNASALQNEETGKRDYFHLACVKEKQAESRVPKYAEDPGY